MFQDVMAAGSGDNRLRSALYPARLVAALSTMRAKQQLTDLTILIGDHETMFHVHKCVMVAASKHFATLVEGGQLVDSHCLIRGIAAEDWEVLLEFIYTGSLRLNEGNINNLYSTAQQLGIAEAELLCEQYISEKCESVIMETDFAEEEWEVVDDFSTENETPGADENNDQEDLNTKPIVTGKISVKIESEHQPSVSSVSRDILSSGSRETHSESRDNRDDDDNAQTINWELGDMNRVTLDDQGQFKVINAQSRKRPHAESQGDGEPDDSDFANTFIKREKSTVSSAEPRPTAGSRTDTGGKRRRVGSSDECSETSGVTEGGGGVTGTLQQGTRTSRKLLTDTYRRKKAKFPFNKYGRMVDIWQDPSIDSTPLPAFQCRRCPFRAFRAASLGLHHLYRHAQPPNSVRHGRKVARALQRVQAARALRRMPHEGTFRCRLCNTAFSVRSRGTSHVLLRHSAQQVRCLHCQDWLQAATRNSSHRCRETGCAAPLGVNLPPFLPPVMFCRQCPRQFRHIRVIRLHYEREHPEADLSEDLAFDLGFCCRHCGQSFLRLHAYIVHLFTHGLHDKEVDLEFLDPSRVAVRSVQPQAAQNVGDQQQRLYSCPDCSSRFNSRLKLDLHLMNKHHKRLQLAEQPRKNRYANKVACEEEGCGLVFFRMIELRAHINNVHPGTNYGCTFCTYTSTIKSKYNNHVRLRHNAASSDRTCEHCGRHFDKKVRLRQHLHSKHGIKDPSLQVFRCDFPDCDYEVFTRYGLDMHKQRHTSEKTHPCDQCSKLFKSERGLQKHVEKLHQGVRPWVCDECGQAFSERVILERHQTRHTGEKQFHCLHCDYATNEKGNFNSHMFSKHERFKERPSTAGGARRVYTCELCGYRCDQRHRWREHQDSHEKILRHACPHCDQAFVARYSLTYHIRKFHQGVHYECGQCSFKAPTVSKLRFHERTKHTHVGVKPYKCYYCDFYSANSGNVNKHVRKKHPGQRFRWVKVGTFDSLAPQHDLLAGCGEEGGGGELAPIAIRESQDYTHSLLLSNTQGADTRMATLATSSDGGGGSEQYFLATEYENGRPIVRLLSQAQLDALRLEAAAGGELAGEGEVGQASLTAKGGTGGGDGVESFHLAHTTDSATSTALELTAQQLQLRNEGTAVMQLGDEQLQQVLEGGEQDGNMQVIYLPADSMMVAGGGDGGDSHQPEQLYVIH